MSELFPDALRHADAAYDSIRAVAHTVPRVLRAPIAYEILGNLKLIGQVAPDAFTRIAAGLDRALTEFEMYEDDGGDPDERVGIAVQHLMRAAAYATRVRDELEAAQSAIAHQGYRNTGSDGARRTAPDTQE